MKKLHVFTIATGIYNKYLVYQFKTIGNLFPGVEKTYNVMSDVAPDFSLITDSCVVKTEYYHICNLPYPLVTLNKFTMLCDMCTMLKYEGSDLFLFVDADTIFCDKTNCTEPDIWTKIWGQLAGHEICYALSPYNKDKLGIHENNGNTRSCSHISNINDINCMKYAQTSFLMGSIDGIMDLNVEMCNMQAYDMNHDQCMRIVPKMMEQSYFNKIIYQPKKRWDFCFNWYIHNNYFLDVSPENIPADFSEDEKWLSPYCICMQKWAHREKMKYKRNSTSFSMSI